MIDNDEKMRLSIHLHNELHRVGWKAPCWNHPEPRPSKLISGHKDSELIRPNVILSIIDDLGRRDWEICGDALHPASIIGHFVSKVTLFANACPAPILYSEKGAQMPKSLP